MIGTRRTTRIFDWLVGVKDREPAPCTLTGEGPPQLEASAPVCQDRWRSPTEIPKRAGRCGAPQHYCVLALALLLLPPELATAGAVVAVGVLFVLFLMVRARGQANARLADQNKQLGRKNSELAAALRVGERKATESAATLTERIRQLEQEVKCLCDVPPEEPACNEGGKIRLMVPSDGREVFFPPLDPYRVYEITIGGACKFSELAGWFSRREGRADALHRTDKVGNFTVRHDCLKLDGVPISRLLRDAPPEAMFEEDREVHRYGFRIDGVAEKVSVSFHLEFNTLCDGPTGHLALTVEVLPEGTPSPGTRRRGKEADSKEAKEGRRAARESAKHGALETRLEKLRLRVHRENHFLDPEFQENFARKSPATIKDIKNEWAREYERFMQDAGLKRLAEESAPEVLQWLEARVKIMQLADRFMVGTARRPERTRELNAAEKRARKLRKVAVRADDKIARVKLKAEKIVKAKAVIDALPLEDDEKEEFKTELSDAIRDDGEKEGRNGNQTTL